MTARALLKSWATPPASSPSARSRSPWTTRCRDSSAVRGRPAARRRGGCSPGRSPPGRRTPGGGPPPPPRSRAARGWRWTGPRAAPPSAGAAPPASSGCRRWPGARAARRSGRRRCVEAVPRPDGPTLAEHRPITPTPRGVTWPTWKTRPPPAEGDGDEEPSAWSTLSPEERTLKRGSTLSTIRWTTAVRSRPLGEGAAHPRQLLGLLAAPRGFRVERPWPRPRSPGRRGASGARGRSRSAAGRRWTRPPGCPGRCRPAP